MKNNEYTPDEARAIYLAAAWFISVAVAFVAGGGFVYLLMK